MASSSIPAVPSPLSREQRDTIAGPSSVSSMATPGYMTNGHTMFVPINGGNDNFLGCNDASASSSRSRLRQSFQPYTGPSGYIPLAMNNNNNITNTTNNFVPSQPGLSPFNFTGPVPYVQAPPATGPCPLAETVDLASLPALEPTGNDTSVTASPTSPTGAINQTMYSSGYLPSAPIGYAPFQPQSLAGPSGGGESSKAINMNNQWSATDTSDWEDPYAMGGINDSRLAVQRPSNYGAPRQLMSTWAPQPSPHQPTPSSSTGSPASPPHATQQHLSHPAHPKPTTAAATQVKVPRPPNAWILYRSEMLNQIRNGQIPTGLQDVVNAQQSARSSSTTSASEGEAKKGKKSSKESSAAVIAQLGGGKAGRGLPQADISKFISVLWKKEKDEVRRKYEQLAEIKKIEHQKLYPNYKFQPVRKEEKLAQRAERAKERDERRREKELFRQRQRRRMRRGMSPHDHDEGHVVSMSRSSSYPGPEGSSYHVSYGAGSWAQANATAEESEGEAMQTSLAEQVVFDTSLLAMPVQGQAASQFSMIHPIQIGQMNGQMNDTQQAGMRVPNNTEMPPSPQRSNGQNLSSSYTDGSSEWSAPPPGAYVGGQLTILTPPDDGSQLDANGLPIQQQPLSMQDQAGKKEQAIYTFQPPNLPPEVQVTDPEALAVLWCKLEPDAFDVTNASANPSPLVVFPTPPMAPPVDNAAWDQHDMSFSGPASIILQDWKNQLIPGGNNGLMMAPTINYPQGQTPSDQQQQQQQQQQQPNFQGTLAPTPSFSTQASPVDGNNLARASPLSMRPNGWGFVNQSPNSFSNSMSTSVPRNVSGPYSTPLTLDPDSFGARFEDTFNNGNMGKDMLNPADMVGPPTAYPPGFAPPNASVGFPVSITNIPVGPAPRAVRRPRQVASKYEAVAGA